MTVATEPIQAGPYPVPGDAPDGPNQLKAIVDWTAPRLNMRFASTAARDAAIPTPTEGMECVTGTGAAMVKWLYFGAGWRDATVRPSVSAAPTLTAVTTNPTLGTGAALVGRYLRTGNLVTYFFRITFGTSGVASGSGRYRISLPVPAAATAVDVGLGVVRLYDSSTGRASMSGRIVVEATSIAKVQYVGPQAALGELGFLADLTNSTPWTWAENDIIDGFITYEAA
jgi:hypothetical protein